MKEGKRILKEKSLNYQISSALFLVVLDHSKAIELLIKEDLIASALALLRPLFEGFVRGKWILSCATSEQVEKFRKKNDSRNSIQTLFPLIEDIEKVDRKYKSELSKIVKNYKHSFNDYTHGGIRQVFWRLEADKDNVLKQIGKAYPESISKELLYNIKVTKKWTINELDNMTTEDKTNC